MAQNWTISAWCSAALEASLDAYTSLTDLLNPKPNKFILILKCVQSKQDELNWIQYGFA